MAGYRGLRVSSPMASRVDYKGGGDLKSCFSEFSLNLLVAPPSVGHSPILTEYHVSDLLLLSSPSRFSRDALVTYFFYRHPPVSVATHFAEVFRQPEYSCTDRPPHLFRARYLQIIADHQYYSLVLEVLFLRSHTAIPSSTYVDIRTTHVKPKVYARRF